MFTIYAHAKINLFLNVIDKLPNGYHTIDSVMHSISLHDLISLDITYNNTISLTCSDPSLPCFGDNLAYAAAVLFRNQLNSDFGVNIHIDKNIPVAAGLAGGSSDAAAVLIGLNYLLHTGLSSAQLCSLGLKLGADVPFCILKSPHRAGGIGEILTPSPPLPPCSLIIAVGHDMVSTKSAYSHIDSLGFVSHDNSLINSLLSGNLSSVCNDLFNVFESTANGIDIIKNIMLSNNALGTLMSGSGPAVFGIYNLLDSLSIQNSILSLNNNGFRTFLCKPIY